MKNYTAQELKEICDNGECNICPFSSYEGTTLDGEECYYCRFSDYAPCFWNVGTNNRECYK